MKKYLQALVFKFLEGGKPGLAYIDGFSGPWKSATQDYSDTSFKIALDVLRDAHSKYADREIKCFFVEENHRSFMELQAVVQAYHSPDTKFYVEAFEGRFEDAVPDIVQFIGSSFALTFIDPTGWTGFPLAKIAPLLRRPGEVLVNFMFDFVNRFSNWDDKKNVATFDPILGGPNWKERLDRTLPIGVAIEKLFCEQIKSVGKYHYVLSTRITKSLADRPHFSIVYATRSPKGLTTFRDIEHDVLDDHQQNISQVRFEREAERTGQASLFGVEDLPDANSFEHIVRDNIERAQKWILVHLSNSDPGVTFESLWQLVLERFLVRQTNVKDICVELAKKGLIRDTWTLHGKRKPHDYHRIELVPGTSTLGKGPTS